MFLAIFGPGLLQIHAGPRGGRLDNNGSVTVAFFLEGQPPPQHVIPTLHCAIDIDNATAARIALLKILFHIRRSLCSSR